MKKIPCIFMTDHDKHEVLNTVNPNAEFIFDHPEARATIKKDGTAIMLSDDGRWFARRSVRPGKKTPEGFVVADVDPNTGIAFGWEPIEASSFHKAFKEAMRNETRTFTPGTFELIGRSINGNPERVDGHRIVAHGEENAVGFPSISEISNHRDDIMNFLMDFFVDFKNNDIEGVVWWIVDENTNTEVPAVKIRVKDFFGNTHRS